MAKQQYFADLDVGGAVIKIGWLNDKRVQAELERNGGRAALYAYAPTVSPTGTIGYGRDRSVIKTSSGAKVLAFGPGDAEAIKQAKQLVLAGLKSKPAGAGVRSPRQVTMVEAMELRAVHRGMRKHQWHSRRSAIPKWQQYCELAGKRNLKVAELTDEIVAGFERWMAHDAGLALSTVKSYSTYLRVAWADAQRPMETNEQKRDRTYKTVQLCTPCDHTITPSSFNLDKLASSLGVVYEKAEKCTGSPKMWARLFDQVDFSNPNEVGSYRLIMISLLTGLRPEHVSQIDWSKRERNFGGYGYTAIKTKQAAHPKFWADNKGRPDIRLCDTLAALLDRWNLSFVYDDINTPDKVYESREAIRWRTRAHLIKWHERAGIAKADRVTVSSTRHTVYSRIDGLRACERYMGHGGNSMGARHYIHRTADWYAEVTAELEAMAAEIREHFPHI